MTDPILHLMTKTNLVSEMFMFQKSQDYGQYP
jgi:hypothetical protein